MGSSCSRRIVHNDPDGLLDVDLESGSSRGSGGSNPERPLADPSEALFNDKVRRVSEAMKQGASASQAGAPRMAEHRAHDSAHRPSNGSSTAPAARPQR
eukprot:CAMPEP_0113669054 /NCGR_PEP_ID=MMETSP0038_2-20120614/4355_1 /TAXON_ID=2898 /ORGANISM="Cryptomonas paramecium" /LENGTH=98 /DNA_ID=CAMNT_0000584891 /DNA_START=242 /DNA_END=535 /DNA_ORIENTATION=+ /assembly_acc=CAM_ASM_000170